MPYLKAYNDRTAMLQLEVTVECI